jgi:hypothetical protein
MTVHIFKNRYQANKVAKTLVGWSYKIIKVYDGYAIKCHGHRFLLINGFIN